MSNLIAFLLIVVGILGILGSIWMFSLLIFHRIQVIIGKFRKIDHPVQYYSTLTKTVSLVFLLFFSISLFLTGGIIRTFNVFLVDRTIAEVTCLSKSTDNSFIIRLIQKNEKQSQAREFVVRGDQWVLEADFVRWNKMVQFLGGKNLYRLSRLSGRFFSTDTQTQHHPSAYSLVELENNPIWKFLYYFGYQIPGINAVYGSGVFQRMEPNTTYNVILTPSGLGLIRKNP